MLRSRIAKKPQLHPEVAAWLIEHGNLDRFGADPLFTSPNAQNDERRWKEGSERRVLVEAYKAAGIFNPKAKGASNEKTAT